jgi:CRISPR-associated protein Csb1
MSFDELLRAAGPVALTIKENLEPVQGPGSVIFPPTFAAPQDQRDEGPSYVIDSNVKIGLVDSVGSQANRIEPIFKRKEYAGLVPQARVTVGERSIDLLDASHRAADAVFRFSDHGAQLRAAFEAIRDRGDSSLLAKIAPTSLVFGVWDSRDTRVKVPRIVGSVIRAHDVEQLTRSAQFFASLEKEETESLPLDLEGKARQDFLSNQGLSDSPAGRGPGGIIARGGVVREATLNLIVVRSLMADKDDETVKLQRYILGLALVAFFAPAEMFLREGCLLVRSHDKPVKASVVHRDGTRTTLEILEQDALAYATDAAKQFGVGAGFKATFQPERVKAVKTDADAKKAAKAEADAKRAKAKK